MKNNYYLPTAIALAVMALLSGCQRDSIKPQSYCNDTSLTFNVSLYGSNKSKETRSSELLSVDRQVNWTPGSTMQEMTLSAVSGVTQLAVDATTGVIGGTDGTFLLVPQNLAEQTITITVLAEIDGVETVLTANIEEGRWKAGYTNTYTLGI